MASGTFKQPVHPSNWKGRRNVRSPHRTVHSYAARARQHSRYFHRSWLFVADAGTASLATWNHFQHSRVPAGMQRRFPIEAGPRLSDADPGLVRGHNNLHEDTLQRTFPGAVLHAFDDYTSVVTLVSPAVILGGMTRDAKAKAMPPC